MDGKQLNAREEFELSDRHNDARIHTKTFIAGTEKLPFSHIALCCGKGGGIFPGFPIPEPDPPREPPEIHPILGSCSSSLHLIMRDDDSAFAGITCFILCES